MNNDRDMFGKLRSKKETLGDVSVEEQEVDEEFLKRKELDEADVDPYENEERREQREQMRLRSRYLSKHCRRK